MARDPSCIFCRIVAGEIPSRKAYEDDDILVFHDIAPWAPVHVLVIPEHHVETFREIERFEAAEAKRMLEFVAETAKRVGLTDYRVVVNVGPGGGQTIYHLHWHVLGGSTMAEGTM